MAVEPVVEFLLRPESYPEKTDKVEHRQTHISHVFLTDRFVYKMKKPVDFGFLDYTTLEKRRHFCGEEIRLNSRLSASLYLGVESITASKDGLEFNGPGEAVEYLVKMRRMPADSIMTKQVQEGNVDERTVAKLARIIADFHKKAMLPENRDEEMLKEYGIDAIRAATEQNFEQTEKYIGTLIDKKKFDHIKQATDDFFLGKEDLFESRVADRRIGEYHGDLHTGNVFIDKGEILVFDCIEFNEAFRCGDFTGDIAFMAMDLDYLGREDLSKHFVRKYIQYTGDYLAYSLLNLFKCYRAYVRAKVTSFMLDDPSLPEAERAELEQAAKKYYWLALDYSRRLGTQKPLLLISCGCSGTGKSRWLQAAADIVGATVLSTDTARRKLFGISGSEEKDDEYWEKYYNEKSRQMVYEYLFGKADRILRSGGKVAIDATFVKKSNREMARKLAEKHGADFLIVHTLAKEDTIKARISKRMMAKNNVSDADFEHAYMSQKQEFEALDDEPAIILDTERPAKENIRQLHEEIESRLSHDQY